MWWSSACDVLSAGVWQGGFEPRREERWTARVLQFLLRGHCCLSPFEDQIVSLTLETLLVFAVDGPQPCKVILNGRNLCKFLASNSWMGAYSVTQQLWRGRTTICCGFLVRFVCLQMADSGRSLTRFAPMLLITAHPHFLPFMMIFMLQCKRWLYPVTETHLTFQSSGHRNFYVPRSILRRSFSSARMRANPQAPILPRPLCGTRSSSWRPQTPPWSPSWRGWIMSASSSAHWLRAWKNSSRARRKTRRRYVDTDQGFSVSLWILIKVSASV
jgi:hypothetical protein